MDDLDEELRMLRIGKVLDLIPVSKVSLYRMIKRGEFPPPAKLGGTSVWSNKDVRKWHRDQFAPKSSRRDDSDLL